MVKSYVKVDKLIIKYKTWYWRSDGAFVYMHATLLLHDWLDIIIQTNGNVEQGIRCEFELVV